jgi:Xaa-Pro aminopeptidase
LDRSKHTDTARIRRLVREADFDGVIGTAPFNVTHMSGYYNLDQRLLPEHLHAILWPASGEPVLVIPSRERQLETFVSDVRTYPAYGGAPDQGERVLAQAVIDRGLATGRIGIDVKALSAAQMTHLTALLPGAKLEAADQLLERMRNVKTPAEIETIRHAAAGTDSATAQGYKEAKPAQTEKEIVDRIDFHTLQNGAETVAFNIIASGARTLLGHHRAEQVAVKNGDVVRVDYGGLFSGYLTDLARMAVVGKPSDRQQSIYARCLEIQKVCVEACKPGVTGGEVDALARSLYAKAKLPLTRNMFGHSIGLTIHEHPIIAPGETLPLEANMVVCVENGWSDVEHGERYHLEDMILVTLSGPKVLSDRFDASQLFVIS